MVSELQKAEDVENHTPIVLILVLMEDGLGDNYV